eukprot:snap_masked-scaffold_15-processed-gene-6.11-mRNA-1 protein AED:1.00 eAED:1.00 QI:0/0/0/0/1/1/2/0/117
MDKSNSKTGVFLVEAVSDISKPQIKNDLEDTDPTNKNKFSRSRQQIRENGDKIESFVAFEYTPLPIKVKEEDILYVRNAEIKNGLLLLTQTNVVKASEKDPICKRLREKSNEIIEIL